MPDAVYVLNCQLAPFSLGHYCILLRDNNCFVNEDFDKEPKPSVINLLQGVFVCSMQYDEFLEWKQSKHFAKDILEDIDAIVESVADDAFNIMEEIEHFRLYIKRATKMPVHYPVASNNKKLAGSHWTHNVKTRLITAGYKEERVMNMPLGQALHDYMKLMENDGLVDLPRAGDLERAKMNSHLWRKKEDTCQI